MKLAPQQRPAQRSAEQYHCRHRSQVQREVDRGDVIGMEKFQQKGGARGDTERTQDRHGDWVQGRARRSIANNNTASGYGSLLSNTTGGANTAIGASALFNMISGSSNIAP